MDEMGAALRRAMIPRVLECKFAAEPDDVRSHQWVEMLKAAVTAPVGSERSASARLSLPLA
eukprot:8050837-Pyramimonas_sp.AAC.1